MRTRYWAALVTQGNQRYLAERYRGWPFLFGSRRECAAAIRLGEATRSKTVDVRPVRMRLTIDEET